MSDQNRTRPRARTDLSPHSRPQFEHSPHSNPPERRARENEGSAREPEFAPPRRAATLSAQDAARTTGRARAGTGASQVPTIELDGVSSNGGLRRRPTTRSGPPSAARVSEQMPTLAGPEDTSQLRTAHEPFVQPGYAELNPAYEQPANTKPVWSLAKPLPRVVRAGMVPTRSEVFESRVRPEMPGENSQRMGLEVDPNDLEKGKVQVTPDPRKIAAQVKDSRVQRENNFIASIQRRGTISRPAASGRLSIAGSGASVRPAARRRSSASAVRPQVMWEDLTDDEDEKKDGDLQEKTGAEDPKRSSMESQQSQQSQPAYDEHHFDTPAQKVPSLDPIPEGRETRPASEAGSDGASSSVSTMHEENEPEVWKDMEPLMQNLVEDEVHNNHTAWSVIRTQNREFLAEFLGVFIQLVIAFASDLSVVVGRTPSPNTAVFAWGFATMIGIYVSGGISGAHLNPALTLMLWWFRGFPKRKMPAYWAAQFLGAFFAAYTAYGVYSASIHNYLASETSEGIINAFVTSQRSSFIDPPTAFFNEFLGTAILSAAVLALGDDQNAPPGAGMNAFVIGLLITVLCIAFGSQTGAAINPSRDFGPRLALLSLGYGKRLFTNPYWFYGPWAGTITGAFVGAALYDIAIFTGGESPINYPLTRTKRSLKKSKRKWARRFHLSKKKTEKEQDDVTPWPAVTTA